MNNNNIVFVSIQSPLEQFEIIPFLGLNIHMLGYMQFVFTNFGLYSLLTLTIIVLYFTIGNNNERIISNYIIVGTESLYQTIHNMVKVQIGGPEQRSPGELYFPFIFSLFTFILFANIISLIPYSFAVTSHMVFSLTISLSILIGVTILGFNLHGIKYLSLLVPMGAPIILLPFLIILELISYIAKGVSHGLRLAINLLAGHCLMLIIAGFIFNFIVNGPLGIFNILISPIPIMILILIYGLELGISFIQAYVFSLLASSYISDSIKLH